MEKKAKWEIKTATFKSINLEKEGKIKQFKAEAAHAKWNFYQQGGRFVNKYLNYM